MPEWALYAQKKAFEKPEMRLYCDKILASAKTKKHPDKKFRNDKDMNLYKVLLTCSEVARSSSKRGTNMTIEAGVDPSAQSSVINTFAKVPTAADEEDTEKPAKKEKMGIKDQRLNKIKEDLNAATLTCTLIDAAVGHQLVYLKPVKENLLSNASIMKKMSHDLHEAVLHGAADEAVEKFWADISFVSKALTSDIDIARSLLKPGAYTPHTTQWDAVLV